MESNNEVTKLEVWHKDYNLDHRDNLLDIPSSEGVFGLFGIIDDEPVNCRWVDAADDLNAAVRNVFETPASEGLRKFMQGPWIQMLQYQLLPGSSAEQRQVAASEWMTRFSPAIDENGDYPGYYNA